MGAEKPERRQDPEVQIQDNNLLNRLVELFGNLTRTDVHAVSLERGSRQEALREEGVSPSRDEPIGIPDTIRRFHKLGVVLQADDDAHGDWYVFVKDRRYIVKCSYGLELHRMTRGKMVLIERAFRTHILNAEEFMHILMEGQPYFNDLMDSIIDNLAKL